MRIDTIRFEPNSSYVAEGSCSMDMPGMQGASFACSAIHIETDEHGDVISYSDGRSTELWWAETWNYSKVKNIKTGKAWDLRLFNAAISGDAKLAQQALREGADPNLQMQQGATALHWAAAQGQYKVCEMLLKQGADVNIADDLGWLPAFLANQQGYPDITRLCLTYGSKRECTVNGYYKKTLP